MYENVYGIWRGSLASNNDIYQLDAPEGQEYCVGAEIDVDGRTFRTCLATFFTAEAMESAFELAVEVFSNVTLFGVPSRSDNWGLAHAVTDRDLIRSTLMLDLRQLQRVGREEVLHSRLVPQSVNVRQDRVISLREEPEAPALMNDPAPPGARTLYVPFSAILTPEQLEVARLRGFPAHILDGHTAISPEYARCINQTATRFHIN